MTNLFDYLAWRGDLTLSQIPFGNVDSLLLSVLAYVFFDGILWESPYRRIPLRLAAEVFLARPKEQQKARVEEDILLLEKLAQSRRFQNAELCAYINKLDVTAEKQFSAVTILLEDETAFLAFRGTDSSLVGWKEDFNMSFMEEVPAQREAEAYLGMIAACFDAKLRLGGHSKGGNLAVYAAAMSPYEVQSRILSIYNHDGPGFQRNMLRREGYQRIVSRVHTFLPQSSVVGMLLEHEEAYSVVKSNQIGIFQHNPYSWEVLGADFVCLEALSERSRFLDRTVKAWLTGLSDERREQFVDTIYEALTLAGMEKTGEIVLSPKSVYHTLQILKEEDEETKRMMVESLKLLIQAAKETAYMALPRIGQMGKG